MKRVIILLFILLLPAFILPVFCVKSATVQEEINARNKQIQDIQRQIEEYQKQIDETGSRAETLSGEISKLNAQIDQIQLEIKSLSISIDQTNYEIGDTQNKIKDSENKLELHKKALSNLISLLYQIDQENLTTVLIKNNRLSDFFDNLRNIESIQNNIKVTIDEIKKTKLDLEEKQLSLEDKQGELQKLKTFQESAKQSLGSDKNAKDKLLKETKGQEAKYQEMVKKSQKDIEAIRSQITYLEQNGITAEEAVKYGQLAALRTGIRPAYLLAELNQESGLGINVGKCTLVDTVSGASRHIVTGKVSAKGINPTRDLPLFLSIVAELGKDPMQTLISCWPGYGWGGAMGPAQFIPSTWMGYRDQVSQLTGHNPANPWSIEDAFVAAAAKLAHDGADSKTRAGEVAASKKYFCGNTKSTKSSCVNYANSVQNRAAAIEQNL
jgi:peptidoglycan hydrolase CwlO-like protein